MRQNQLLLRTIINKGCFYGRFDIIYMQTKMIKRITLFAIAFPRFGPILFAMPDTKDTNGRR